MSKSSSKTAAATQPAATASPGSPAVQQPPAPTPAAPVTGPQSGAVPPAGPAPAASAPGAVNQPADKPVVPPAVKPKKDVEAADYPVVECPCGSKNTVRLPEVTERMKQEKWRKRYCRECRRNFKEPLRD